MAHTREAVGSQALRAHCSGEGGGHENHQRVGGQQPVCMHATWNDMHGLAM